MLLGAGTNVSVAKEHHISPRPPSPRSPRVQTSLPAPRRGFETQPRKMQAEREVAAAEVEQEVQAGPYPIESLQVGGAGHGRGRTGPAAPPGGLMSPPRRSWGSRPPTSRS
jgi:hypothetical protein